MSNGENRDAKFVGTEACCLCMIETLLKTSTNEKGRVIKRGQCGPEYGRDGQKRCCVSVYFHSRYTFENFLGRTL